jgi:hypothetical protein
MREATTLLRLAAHNNCDSSIEPQRHNIRSKSWDGNTAACISIICTIMSGLAEMLLHRGTRTDTDQAQSGRAVVKGNNTTSVTCRWVAKC